MAVIKCKMCGGAINIGSESVATCEYCGTQQTLPKLGDDRRVTLYERAGHFRRNNEYDKAMGIYEQILSEDLTDAESYWSLVLCRYGIEYVEDPATRKRVPTVNRAQFTSVFDDENYQSALRYADRFQRQIYEAEAKAINEIQKGILEISQKEEPFDVFICYKETDANGRRTPDSVLATELYHQLTQEGFKVFFSRITLEDKLGTAYEPYIFAALNSAKIMIVLGTKQAYFNAVWVKNEWSRYLSFIQNGADKILIPAYRDMNPYDLPEEFSHLQAQDMGKLGFMQDLLRSIKKQARAEMPSQAVAKEKVVVTVERDAKALLKRAFLSLEDGEWEQAENFCEQVLNIDPECAEGYLGKLLAELHVHTQAELKDCAEPFAESENYRKLIRLSDEKLRAELHGYLNYINEHQQDRPRKGADQKAKSNEKNRALPWIAAIAACVVIAFFTVLKVGDPSAKQYNHAISLMERGGYEDAIAIFEALGTYKDSAARIVECELALLEREYAEAVALMDAADYEAAVLAFEALDGYKDSLDRIASCHAAILDIQYNEVLALMRDGNYEEAIVSAEALGEAGADLIIECRYLKATKLMESGEVLSALRSFTELGDYKDAKSQADELRVRYQKMLQKSSIAAGQHHTVALKEDGSIVAVGSSDDALFAVSGWKNIVDIDAGTEFTVGLKANGTIALMGYYDVGRMGSIFDWKDIVSVSSSSEITWLRHVIGLKSDGTVVAAGFDEYGRCNVSGWRDIIAISTGNWHTVGLKSDGTVVAVGDNGSGCCNVSDWTDIIAVCGRNSYTVGLKKDGTVVAVGENYFGQINVSDWKDIVAISTRGNHTVGLKADGTVVATGYNEYGQCNVAGWTDIVAVYAGYHHTVGLKADGTVVAVGYNKDGQCDVSGWTNIRLPE